jgi:hypothetical protein
VDKMRENPTETRDSASCKQAWLRSSTKHCYKSKLAPNVIDHSVLELLRDDRLAGAAMAEGGRASSLQLE